MFWIAAAILFFGAIGAALWYLNKEIKKTERSFGTGDKKEKARTAQEFLPCKEIANGITRLDGNKYRLHMEVGAVNYRLKSETEQEVIELAFNRFCTALSFPVQVFIQSRKIDNSHMVAGLTKDTAEICEKFPQLAGYAARHIKNMENITEHIGNNIQKRNYIVVPWDYTGGLEKLSEDERYDYALKELYTRATILTDELSRVGILARPMNTGQVAELFYTTFNRDRKGLRSDLTDAGFQSLMVKNIYDYLPARTPRDRLLESLDGLENQLQTDLSGCSDPWLEQALQAVSALKEKTLQWGELRVVREENKAAG